MRRCQPLIFIECATLSPSARAGSPVPVGDDRPANGRLLPVGRSVGRSPADLAELRPTERRSADVETNFTTPSPCRAEARGTGGTAAGWRHRPGQPRTANRHQAAHCNPLRLDALIHLRDDTNSLCAPLADVCRRTFARPLFLLSRFTNLYQEINKCVACSFWLLVSRARELRMFYIGYHAVLQLLIK